MDKDNLPAEVRKYHYWRGFKAACALTAAVLIPVAVGAAIYLNHVLAVLK